MMFAIKRGLVNVSLLPVGSSYRLRIPLPSAGECWFTVDSSQDIASFLEEIKAEDELVQKVETEHPYMLFNEAAEVGFTISVNGTNYSLKKTVSAEVIKSQSIIQSVIEKLENSEISSKKELDLIVTSVLTELGEQFDTYLKVLRSTLKDIDTQIDMIVKKENEIVKKIKRRSDLYSGGVLGMLALQWGFFYYTIYEVEWLGWDLMEPITFTVGQSSFVFSLWYYLRTQQAQSYENVLSSYESKRKIFMLKMHGIDVGRLKFLTEEKRRIISLIDVIEKRLV